MIHHHPGDDLLLALAAGGLGAGQSLVLSVHLEQCDHCRERLHTLQALGGALLEEAEPVPLSADAWIETLERLDAGDDPAPVAAVDRPHADWRASLPPTDALVWPESLRGCRATPWRWVGPGVSFSRLQMPADPDGSLFLLRIGAGRSLPRHSHADIEFTQVLSGAFDDGRSVFGPGDFDETDGEVHHQPAVLPSGECICLAYLGGRLRFEGRIASVLGRMIGM
ncbi:MAG: ChrR family anti-sigma-E factor [Burkholderiaceae bacterium]